MSVVAVVRLLPMRGGARRRAAARPGVPRVRRRRTGGCAMRNLAGGVSGAQPTRECRAIARRMFAHFGRLLMVLLKFSTMTPARDAARASSSRARSACAPRTRSGAACCSSPGTSGSGRSTRWCTRWRCSRWRCWRGRSTTRCCTTCSSRCGRTTGNSVIYRRGAIRRVLRALEANQAVAVLIDQHIQTADAVYVDFFNRPAATTSALAALALRTGAPVVPVFALPLPGGRFRMVYEHAGRAAAGRRSGRHPRVHAALHRRARDVRAPLSGAVAVDAPPLARRRAEGRAGARHVSDRERRRAARVTARRTPAAAVARLVDPRAELAGRRGDGAAGDGARCARAFPTRTLAVAARRRRSRRSSAKRPTPAQDERARRRRSAAARRRALRGRRGSTPSLLLPNSFRRRGRRGGPASPSGGATRPASGGWLLTRAVARPRGARASVRRTTSSSCAALGSRARRCAAARRRRAGDASRARTALLREHRRRDRRDRCVGFAPGAAYGHAKRWPPRARGRGRSSRLSRERGARCVLVGAAGDRDAGREIESSLPPDVRRRSNLIGRTDLRAAGRRAAPVRRVRVERFRRHAPGGRRSACRSTAIFGPTDERVDRADRRSRRARAPGVLPPLHAARLPDRSPLHEGHHRRRGRRRQRRRGSARRAARMRPRACSWIATAR